MAPYWPWLNQIYRALPRCRKPLGDGINAHGPENILLGGRDNLHLCRGGLRQPPWGMGLSQSASSVDGQPSLLVRHRNSAERRWVEAHGASALGSFVDRWYSDCGVDFQRLRGLASLTGDFCNKICQFRTPASQQRILVRSPRQRDRTKNPGDRGRGFLGPARIDLPRGQNRIPALCCVFINRHQLATTASYSPWA